MAKYNYTQPATELQRFADMVEFPDAEPTENSAQLVTSGGVYDAIKAVEEEAKQLSYNSLMEDTASGSIASFPDGAENVPVKELTAEIEPIQDLHGQASPWPPAGSKNVLPLSVDGIKAANTSGTWSGNAYTLNSVTFTILTDSADNVIGIRANGTASAETSFVLATNSALQVLAGLSLKLNGSTGGSSSTYGLRAVAWNGTNTSGAYDGDSVTFTPTSAFSYVEMRIFSGASVSNKDFYPMLRLSTEADTTFVPYSNICPIYPKAERNLYDKSVTPLQCFIADDGTITASGNNRTIVIPCLPNTQYIIYRWVVGIRFRAVWTTTTPAAGVQGSGRIVNDGGNQITIFTGANATYLVVWVWNNGDAITEEEMLSQIQVEYGFLVHPYTPYGCVERVDVLGKNILDGSIWEFGSINANGGNSSSTAEMRTKLSSRIPVAPNTTYTFSEKEIAPQVWLTEYSDDTLVVPRRYITDNSKTATFTTGADTNFIRLRVTCATSGVLNTETQLEVGTEATAYEAFKDSTYFSLAKNVWDEEWELKSFNTSDHTWDYTVSRVASKDYIPVSPATRYCFTTNYNGNVIYYDSNKNYISYTTSAVSGGYWSFVTPDNCGYMMFQMLGAYGNTYNHDIAILTAPPEIWGGELNVTTGEMTVNASNKVTLNGSETYWTGTALNGSVRRFYSTTTLTQYSGVLACEELKTEEDSAVLNTAFVDANHRLVVTPSWAQDITTVADFKTALASNNIHVLFGLTSPLIYHLDPVEVRTWLAENNITCNTGKIKILVYRCNTALYILKKTEA